MTRCVLVAGIVALIATGCALQPRGLGDISEADAGTSSHGGTPPVAPSDSGIDGASPDGGFPSGSSSEASAPDPGDDTEGDADWDDDGEQPDADAQDTGPVAPGHGHH